LQPQWGNSSLNRSCSYPYRAIEPRLLGWSCYSICPYIVSGLTIEETGNDQRSIDLIDGAAAESYVTSKELRYRRCGGFEVTVRHARAASGHNTMAVNHFALPRGISPLHSKADRVSQELLANTPLARQRTPAFASH
jgi:hypothetical protein